MVEVPDERLERLAKMFRPQKVSAAKVAFADISGLESGAAQKGLPGALLNQLRQSPLDISTFPLYD
ncbi:MAG: hypothetical protein Kow0088_10920 [Anaerolineales bacterium]